MWVVRVNVALITRLRALRGSGSPAGSAIRVIEIVSIVAGITAVGISGTPVTITITIHIVRIVSASTSNMTSPIAKTASYLVSVLVLVSVVLVPVLTRTSPRTSLVVPVRVGVAHVDVGHCVVMGG